MRRVHVAGELWRMGATVREYFGDTDARRHYERAHYVTLSADYYIGVFPMTQGQYRRVMGNLPDDSTAKSYANPDVYPVSGFSYNAIRGSQSQGVNWPRTGHGTVLESGVIGTLRKNTGIMFDLPTEAQWEYAYRAGTTTTYFIGSSTNSLPDYAWYSANSINSSNQRMVYPVGLKTPNPWGIYEMGGTVWEFCLDWYDVFDSSAAIDPSGPEKDDDGLDNSASSTKRVRRGGSGWSNASYLRSASRVDGGVQPKTKGGDYGLRLVCPVGLR